MNASILSRITATVQSTDTATLLTTEARMAARYFDMDWEEAAWTSHFMDAIAVELAARNLVGSN